MAPLLPALVAFLLLLVPGPNAARFLGVGELKRLVQRDVPRRRCVCEAPPLHTAYHHRLRAEQQSYSAAGDAAVFDAHHHRRWRPVPGARSHLGTQHHRRRARLQRSAGCRAWCEQVRATRRRPRLRAAVASLAFNDRHVVYRRSRRHHRYRDGGSARHAHAYASGKLLPASRTELDSPQAAAAAGDYHLQYRHQLPMIETRVPLAQSASWADAGRARTAAPADCESEPEAGGGGVLAVMPAEDAGNATGSSPAVLARADGGAGGACKPGAEGMTPGEVYAHLLKQDRARMAAWKRRRHAQHLVRTAQQRRGSRVWRSENFEYGAWDWLSGGGLVWRVVMVGLVLAIMVVWVQWELGETMKAAL